MRKTVCIIAVLTTLLTILFSACSAPSETRILGRWYGSKEINGHIVSYEFFDDKTYVLWHDDRTTFSDGHGTYRIQEGKLKINDYASGSNVFDLEIKKDTLVIDGEIFTKEYKSNKVKNDELLKSTTQNIDVDCAPISANSSHVLAIKDDGTLHKIDLKATIDSKNGLSTKLLDDVAAVSATYDGNNMAIRDNGMLFVWGENTSGEVGNGTHETVNEPEEIMSNIIECSSGPFYSLSIKDDNTLWGWGASGWLRGNSGENNRTPIKIMDNVIKISASKSHAMIVKKDSTLWTMGHNSSGALGDGTTTDNFVLQQIMQDVKQVAAGNDYSMAVTIDGSLWVWGDNYWGQLGDGTRDNSLVPKKIMDNVRYISSCSSYSLAIKQDNTLWAWGNRYLGTDLMGKRENITTPQKILDDVNYISAGYQFAIASTNDGKVWAWRDNKTGDFNLGEGPLGIFDNVLLK